MKKILLKKLNELLDERLESTRQGIAEVIESRDEETKSVMGDKYETSRVMIEMEMDKLQEQLEQLLKHKKIIVQIKSTDILNIVDFGSLVETNQGKYFIAIAFGSINMDGEKIYCISLASPLGQALRDKKAGETLSFQGRDINLIKIE